MAIYVPDYTSNKCAVLQNATTIRVYNQRPTVNSTVSYNDYYIQSDYYFNSGTTTFSQYATNLPTCRTDITTNVYYRYDFDKIMIIFTCICLLLYFFAFKPIQRIMGRWLKL